MQTSTRVVERCLLLSTDPGDLVVDPTCGSGTTAHVAEQWGRRWITIDTSRVAIALARTRLMSARYSYYILLDSPEGQRKAAEYSGALPPQAKTEGDIRKGFVYRHVPHVTLKSITNNPDIQRGMSAQELDAALARYAESEILYDQPSLDPKIVRVCGPFTVESLSPHRVLDLDASDAPASEAVADGNYNFVKVVLDNLKAAGVQNTVKNERLLFDTLEPYPGMYVQASGTYREGETVRRAGISVGPEYGTVSADFVREASKEAANDFDLLVICGMAFDARVGGPGTCSGGLPCCGPAYIPTSAWVATCLRRPPLRTSSPSSASPTSTSVRPMATRSSSRFAGSTSSTRPQVRSAAIQLTTSPAGSSTPTTTKRASSFVMPTSSAATILTRSSAARLRLTSTKPHGPRYTAPSADHLRCH